MSALSGFIDLHSHTNESDGTLTPLELITLARTIGLDALAITDHDTFAGYDLARPIANRNGFDLMRGIELNSKLVLENGDIRTPHLLAYFPVGDPTRGVYDVVTKGSAGPPHTQSSSRRRFGRTRRSHWHRGSRGSRP